MDSIEATGKGQGYFGGLFAKAPMSKLAFFRQSGWLVIATVAGGFLFYAVHIFASKMPQSEYGVFYALLIVLSQMSIPSVGLQTIFMQQTAMGDNDKQRRDLAGAVRSVLKVTFILWLVAALGAFIFQKHILDVYKIKNPVALWATVCLGLTSLWTPIMSGMLQGRQNFLWLGINSIVPAFARLIFVFIIVRLLHGESAGAMIGVLLSTIVGLGFGVWKTHDLWKGEADPFIWKPWLMRVLPLTLGLGAATFMFTFDMIAVQRFLTDTGIYGAAGMIGRALMVLVAPMTMVMFPKIVQAAAKAEKTDVLAQAIGATALLGAGAALFCTFFGDVPLRIVQGAKYLAAAPLIPWFTWCMLPLTVSNVLINNLMARQCYGVVPWLIAVTGGYCGTLWCMLKYKWFPPSHLLVIQTLGVFALLFFLVCLFFTWRSKRIPAVAP
jgi:O-antigen/teichoic acid export membrane protein